VENEREHLEYWQSFYASEERSKVPAEPSAFARWVASREAARGPLVDVGTGTGRDALWFAREGGRVVGLDFAESAVQLATSRAEEQDVDAEFVRLDLYHDGEVDELALKLAADLAPTVIYARFFVHALEDEGRANLWRFARQVLVAGGSLYLEFRVRETQHEFGEHYRHFVSPEVVAAEIVQHGGTVVHQEVGTGLAVYKHEDPLVCRLVASWG
jgi:SAM-dependent methyltransferase